MTERKVIPLLIMLLSYSLIATLLFYPASGIPSSNFISVTYFAQETSYFCGPAVVQMALSYLLDSFPSQDELATEIETDVEAGVTHTNKMREAFDNRGFTQVYEDKLNLDELKTLNSNGYLVIILIYFDITHEYQHYVLVIGYDNNSVYVHDPWPTSWRQPQGRTTGANVSISEELLNDLWSCQPSNWGLAISYVGNSIVPVPWWQEHWYFLVAIPAVVAATVLAIMFVRKKKRLDLNAVSEKRNDLSISKLENSHLE